MNTTGHSSDIERSNHYHLIMEIAWFGLALAATSRFLSVYAIHLGATPIELGYITSLPYIVLLFSTALSTWWRSRYPDSIRALNWPSLGFRLVFLLPALTPLFPRPWQPVWLVLSAALPALPQGISSTIFITMMREAVPENRLTNMMSRRSMWMNITVGVAALGFGVWLEHAPFPLNYQVMFVVAFLLALMSHWHVMRVRVAPRPIVRPNRETIRPGISPLRSPVFQKVAFAAVIIHVAFFAILPVTPLHLVETLGATESFMAFFGIAELTAAALICLFTERLALAIGTRRMIGLAMIGTALSAIIMATADALPITLVGAAISGASWTAATIGLFSYFAESTRDLSAEEITRYSTVYHQVIFLAAFIGPMVGSNMANNGMSLVLVMLFGAVLRMISGGLMYQIDMLWALPMGRLRRARAYRRS